MSHVCLSVTLSDCLFEPQDLSYYKSWEENIWLSISLLY